ncbi:MAG TPA: hypothetical protein VN777_07280 [Terriglobales bacterium]|nr:hypothetical protein [Terriglobales bacterium]HZW92615.1 hypothetical protein [Candidatus Eremiobacteraceae bacterium]
MPASESSSKLLAQETGIIPVGVSGLAGGLVSAADGAGYVLLQPASSKAATVSNRTGKRLVMISGPPLKVI